MKLSDFKIGTKLGAAFFFVVLMTAAAGGFAVVQLAKINANTEDIATNWLPSVEVLSNIRITTNRFRRAEGDHALSTDLKEMDVIEKQFVELKKTLGEQQAIYEPMINSDEEKANYAQYKQHRDAYFSSNEKLVSLSRNGESMHEQTRTYFRGESRNAFNTMVEDLGHLVSINGKGASLSFKTSQTTYAQARGWLISLVLGSIVIATLLAVWITRLI
ncbi:MAG: MCP four helix bundle domain-containing protein, partial [Pseudomonadota bacterium]